MGATLVMGPAKLCGRQASLMVPRRARAVPGDFIALGLRRGPASLCRPKTSQNVNVYLLLDFCESLSTLCASPGKCGSSKANKGLSFKPEARRNNLFPALPTSPFKPAQQDSGVSVAAAQPGLRKAGTLPPVPKRGVEPLQAPATKPGVSAGGVQRSDDCGQVELLAMERR